VTAADIEVDDACMPGQAQRRQHRHGYHIRHLGHGGCGRHLAHETAAAAIACEVSSALLDLKGDTKMYVRGACVLDDGMRTRERERERERKRKRDRERELIWQVYLL
jgi:hypothetical protein